MLGACIQKENRGERKGRETLYILVGVEGFNPQGEEETGEKGEAIHGASSNKPKGFSHLELLSIVTLESIY